MTRDTVTRREAVIRHAAHYVDMDEQGKLVGTEDRHLDQAYQALQRLPADAQTQALLRRLEGKQTEN